MRLIQKLIAACLAHRHQRITEQAIRVAEQHEGSAISDYAWGVAARHSEAAERCRKALREDARTHIGRLGQ